MYTINLKTRLCAVHKRFCLASHSSLFLYSVFKVRLAAGGSRFAFVLAVLRVRVLPRCGFYGLPFCCCFCRGYSLPFCTHCFRELPPVQPVVGSNGLEPSTSRLSGVRSNHLSYEPMSVAVPVAICGQPLVSNSLSAFLLPRAQSFDWYSLQRELPPAQLVVEMNRIELSTPCLQGRCSPS